MNFAHLYGKSGYLSSLAYTLDSEIDEDYIDVYQPITENSFNFFGNRLKLENFNKFLRFIDIDSKCLKGSPFSITHDLDDVYPQLHYERPFNIDKYGHSLYSNFEETSQISKTLDRNRIQVQVHVDTPWDFSSRFPDIWNGRRLEDNEPIFLDKQLSLSDNGLYIRNEQEFLVRHPAYEKDNLSVWLPDNTIKYLQPVKENLNKAYPFDKEFSFYDYTQPYLEPTDLSFLNHQFFQEGDDYLIRNEFDYLLEPSVDFNDTVTLDNNRVLAVGEFGTVALIEEQPDCPEEFIQLVKTYTNQTLNAVTRINDSIWTVGNEGVILYSSNNGLSWDSQRSNTYLDLLGVHFIDRKTGCAVGKEGTLLLTDNGGESWERFDFGDNLELTRDHYDVKLIKTNWGEYIFVGSETGFLFSLFRVKKADNFKLSTIWKMDLSEEEKSNPLYYEIEKESITNNRTDITNIHISYLWQTETNQRWVKYPSIRAGCRDGNIIYSGAIRDDYVARFYARNVASYNVEDVNGNFVPLFNENIDILDIKENIHWDNKETLRTDIILCEGFMLAAIDESNYQFFTDNFGIDFFSHIYKYRRLANSNFIEAFKNEDISYVYIPLEKNARSLSVITTSHIKNISVLDSEEIVTEKILLAGDDNMIKIYGASKELDNIDVYDLSLLSDYACDSGLQIGYTLDELNEREDQLYFGEYEVASEPLLLDLLKPNLIFLDYFAARKLLPLSNPQINIPNSRFNVNRNITIQNQNLKGQKNGLPDSFKLRSVEEVEYVSNELIHNDSSEPMILNLETDELGSLIISIDAETKEGRDFLNGAAVGDLLEVDLLFQDFYYVFNEENILSPNVFDNFGNPRQPFFSPNTEYPQYYLRENLKISSINRGDGKIIFDNFINTGIVEIWSRLSATPIESRDEFDYRFISQNRNFTSKWMDIFDVQNGEGVNNLAYLKGDKSNLYNGIREEDFIHWNGQIRRSALQVSRFNLYNRSLHIGSSLAQYANVLNTHPILSEYYQAEATDESFNITGKPTFSSLFKDLSAIVNIDNSFDYIEYDSSSYYNPGYNLLDFLSSLNSVFNENYLFTRFGEEEKDAYILKDVDFTNKDKEGGVNFRIEGNKIITRYPEASQFIPLTFTQIYKNIFVDAGVQQAEQTVFLRSIETAFYGEDECDIEYTLIFDDIIKDTLKGKSVFFRNNLTLGELSSLLQRTDDIQNEVIKIQTDGYAKVLSNDKNIRTYSSGCFFTDFDNEISLLLFNAEDHNMHYAPIEGWVVASDGVPAKPFNIRNSDVFYERYAEPVLRKQQEEVITELKTAQTNFSSSYYLSFVENEREARVVDKNLQTDYPIFFKSSFDKALSLLGVEEDEGLEVYYTTRCDITQSAVEYVNATYNLDIRVEPYYQEFLETLDFYALQNEQRIRPSSIKEFYYDDFNRVLFIATDIRLFVLDVDFETGYANISSLQPNNIFQSGRVPNLGDEYGDFQHMKIREDYLWILWKVNQTNNRNQRFGFINLQDFNYYELDSLCNSRVIYNPYQEIEVEIDPDESEIVDFDILFKGNSWILAWALEQTISTKLLFSFYFPFTNKHFLLHNIGGGAIEQLNLDTLSYNLDYERDDIETWFPFEEPGGVINTLGFPLLFNGKINSIRYSNVGDENYLLAAHEGREGGLSVIEIKNISNSAVEINATLEYIDYSEESNTSFLRMTEELPDSLYAWREDKSELYFSFYSNDFSITIKPVRLSNGRYKDEQNLIRVEGRLPSEYVTKTTGGFDVSYIHTAYMEVLARRYNDTNKLSGSDVKKLDSTENVNNFLSTYGIEKIIEYAQFQTTGEFTLEGFTPVTKDDIILDYEENERDLFYSKLGTMFELKDSVRVSLRTESLESSFSIIGNLSIEALREKYPWFVNAIVKDALIGETTVVENGINVNKLVWYSGTWVCGRWIDGVWHSGTWIDGTWLNGEWRSDKVEIIDNFPVVDYNDSDISYSQWLNGSFLGGHWKNGTWFNGSFRGNTAEFGILNKSYFEGGLWLGGEFGVAAPEWINDAELERFSQYTYWLGGEWRGGTFHNGRWEKGIFNMFNRPSRWRYGFFYGGDFQNGFWEDGFFSQSAAPSSFGTKASSFYPAIWDNGVWLDGHFWSYKPDNKDYSVNNSYSVWKNGLWTGGVFHGGTMEFVWWRGGIWENGVWNGKIEIDPQTNIWPEQEALYRRDRLIFDNRFLLMLQLPRDKNMKYITDVWSGGEIDWSVVELEDYEYFIFNPEQGKQECIIGGSTTLPVQIENDGEQVANAEESDVSTSDEPSEVGVGVELSSGISVEKADDFSEIVNVREERANLVFQGRYILDNQSITNISQTIFNVEEAQDSVRIGTILQDLSDSRPDLAEEKLIQEIERRSFRNQQLPDGRYYRDVFWSKRINKGGRLPNGEPIPDNARNYFDSNSTEIKPNPFNSDLDFFDNATVKYNEVYKLQNFPCPPFSPQYTHMKTRMIWRRFVEIIGMNFDGETKSNAVFDYLYDRKQNRLYYDFIQTRENNTFSDPNVLSIEMPRNEGDFVSFKRAMMGDSYLTIDERAEINLRAQNESDLEECCVPLEDRIKPIDFSRASFRSMYKSINLYSVWEGGIWKRGIWKDGVFLDGEKRGGLMKHVFWKGGKMT